MDFEALFPGRFLKGVDLLAGDMTLTIKGVRVEELQRRKGIEAVVIMSFSEPNAREVPLNITNATCIAGMFGRDYRGWTGHRVTLCAEELHIPGFPPVAIRVRGSPELAETKRVDITCGLNPYHRMLEPTPTPMMPAPRPPSANGAATYYSLGSGADPLDTLAAARRLPSPNGAARLTIPVDDPEKRG